MRIGFSYTETCAVRNIVAIIEIVTLLLDATGPDFVSVASDIDRNPADAHKSNFVANLDAYFVARCDRDLLPPENTLMACWRYIREVQEAGKPADATGYR